MPKELRLIHLDIDPWEIGKNYPPEVAIMGDPKATLPEITAVVRERMSSGARGAARERLQAASEASRVDRENLVGKARALAAQTPIQPLRMLHAVGEICRRTRWWWRRRCRQRPASAS
jgi:benzoylformate decarboxylase